MLHNFINILKGIDFGFTFASNEDTPNITFLLEYMKFAGVILAQRTNSWDHPINYINQTLFEDVVEANKVTTIYQNTLRIRSGKI